MIAEGRVTADGDYVLLSDRAKMNDFHLRAAIKKDIEEATARYAKALHATFYGCVRGLLGPGLIFYLDIPQYNGLCKEVEVRRLRDGMVEDPAHQVRVHQSMTRQSRIIIAGQEWTRCLFPTGIWARDPMRIIQNNDKV